MQKNAAILSEMRRVFAAKHPEKLPVASFLGLILLHFMILLSKAYGLTFSPVLKSMISAGS